jgi:peptide/nickel transport system permease protein
MTRLIARRLLLSVPLVFIVSVITFLLEAIVPGDPAREIAGANATQAEYEQIRRLLGLNLPLWDQYGRWLEGAIHGNLGTSLFSGQQVAAELNVMAPVTLSLILGVFVVCSALGVLLGVLGARKEGAVGRLIDIVAMLGLSLPAFWVAVVLIGIFAVGLRLFPATGFTPFTASPAGWLRSLILPVVALSLGGVTAVAKQTRESMREVLDRPFIRSLRAAGVSERSIIWKHALKNAAPPALTVLGLVLVSALGGSVFVESVFVLPGLGSAAVQATEQHDLPVIEGIALYFTLITIVINLIVDIAYGWLNPKVRVA